MANIKKMYTKEYAELRSISPEAVTQAINKGHKLPAVKKIERHVRYWFLTVDLDLLPQIEK